MYRTGADREASLESALLVFHDRSGRRYQRRSNSPVAIRDPDLNSLSNRRLRTRMYGGVGGAVSDDVRYPDYRRLWPLGLIRWALGRSELPIRFAL